MPLKRNLRSGGGAEFDWIEAEARTEIVNEAYICSKLNIDVSFHQNFILFADHHKLYYFWIRSIPVNSRLSC
jgi:hypothetical protein